MKKLILAVLVTIIGIAPSQQAVADPSQGVQIIEQAGAGIAGAVIGYKGAQAAGANQPWSIAAGALGTEVGVSIVRTYQQPRRRPIYRGQSQPRYGYGYGGCASQYGDDEELYRECQMGASNRAAANRNEERRVARDYGGGGYGGSSAW